MVRFPPRYRPGSNKATQSSPFLWPSFPCVGFEHLTRIHLLQQSITVFTKKTKQFTVLFRRCIKKAWRTKQFDWVLDRLIAMNNSARNWHTQKRISIYDTLDVSTQKVTGDLASKRNSWVCLFISICNGQQHFYALMAAQCLLSSINWREHLVGNQRKLTCFTLLHHMFGVGTQTVRKCLD